MVPYEGDWSQDKHDGKGIIKNATGVARNNRARNKCAIKKKQDIIVMKNNNTNVQYKVVPFKGS